MTTLNWMLGLVCLLLPTRVEGQLVNWALRKSKQPERVPGKINRKRVELPDQNACGTSRL